MDSRWLVAIVVLNLEFDLLLRSQIAWQAHVGGLLAGGLLTAAFVYAPRRRRALLQAGAAVVLLGAAGRGGRHPQPRYPPATGVVRAARAAGRSAAGTNHQITTRATGYPQACG